MEAAQQVRQKTRVFATWGEVLEDWLQVLTLWRYLLTHVPLLHAGARTSPQGLRCCLVTSLGIDAQDWMWKVQQPRQGLQQLQSLVQSGAFDRLQETPLHHVTHPAMLMTETTAALQREGSQCVLRCVYFAGGSEAMSLLHLFLP